MEQQNLPKKSYILGQRVLLFIRCGRMWDVIPM
jgi:hypothetical protein